MEEKQEKSKELSNQNNLKNEINITEGNWLFLKHIQQGKKVWEAHQLAGYKGDKSAAYNLYYHLRKKLELVYEADNVDSLRLKIEAKKILDMPVEDKPIKPETRLKAIETLHKLQDKDKIEKRQISPFVVLKTDKVEISKNEIIDVKAESNDAA